MTAKLITVCNQKGGCGKTNLAMTLGGSLAERGFSTLIVDGDPQGTATRWFSAASDERPFPAAVIIVDCPPSLESPVTLSTLVVADLALVPVIPAPGDIWATSRLVGLVEQATGMNPGLQIRVVPNMVQGTTLAQAALQALKEIPLPAARAFLTLRTAYRQAQAEGTTVLTLRDLRARDEANAMADEVGKLLGMPKKPAKSSLRRVSN